MHRRSGFTLIEVLVVVAIIALLVAILLPSLARARAQARHTQCLANLHQIGHAMYQYGIENNNVVPRACDDGGGTDYTNWTVTTAKSMSLIKRIPSGFNVNDLDVHQMEIFHCPERQSEVPQPFLDYVVNSMDPEGPRSGGSGSGRDRALGQPDPGGGDWQQVYHFQPATAHLAKINIYKYPSDVAYIMDAEKEDKNEQFYDNPATLRKARLGFYQYQAGGGYGDGAIGVMDVWLGAHVPEGKNNINVDDTRGPRRAARRMHLNRFTNAAFMDGHGAPIQLRASSVDHISNYAFWLRTMGVKDPQRVAELDNDLK